MDTQARAKRLKEIFYESQCLPEFKEIWRQLNKAGVKISPYYNRNEGPAYYSVHDKRVAVNLAFSDEAMRIALDHESTHATQNIPRGYCDMPTNIVMTLLGEVHAYINQTEFAVKRYLDAMHDGSANGSFQAKAFEAAFKKRGVAARPYLEAYLGGLTGQSVKLKYPQDACDILNAYYHTHYARGAHDNTQIKTARKAILKSFFALDMARNNPVLDEYIQSDINWHKENINKLCTDMRSYNLDELASFYKNGSQPVLSANDIREALGIKTKADILNRAMTFSSHRNTYLETLTAFTQQRNKKGFLNFRF